MFLEKFQKQTPKMLQKLYNVFPCTHQSSSSMGDILKDLIVHYENLENTDMSQLAQQTILRSPTFLLSFCLLTNRMKPSVDL